MIDTIYIEHDLIHDTRALDIAKHFPNARIEQIESYDSMWGRFKKPYLHKRTNLNLFLAKKKGKLVKQAPDAYGQAGEPHYYFIHAYNCIYECQYCYLQGYFQTPDLVLFLNHQDIISEMNDIVQAQNQSVWFHAGEFSDSLALTHVTKELPVYYEFFQQYPQAKLELRTKSVNIRELLKLNPLPNVYASFSLSPEPMAKKIDLKTPPLKSRLKAMNELMRAGHKIAIHLDPIIYSDHHKEDYQNLFDELKRFELIDAIEYISLGVVRFTKSVHREVERNYPDSFLHTQPMQTSFDQKVRYEHSLRHWLMATVKDIAIECGVANEKIYLCMEREEELS